MQEQQLLEERNFLMQRMLAQHRRAIPRCYGISSNALALYGIGSGPRPQTPGHPEPGHLRAWYGKECGTDYPHDIDDLDACERTYEMAPKHLKEKMLPVLVEFRMWILEGRNRYGEEPKKQRDTV